MNFMEKEKNIGVLDSGLGGLTAVKKIVSALPKENIVYFGDTARAPYDSKSDETIFDYSIQGLKFLLNKNVKIIVLACNTISSVAFDELKKITSVPIINIIEVGANMAADLKDKKKTGVIGTETVINKKAYSRIINSINPNIEVVEKACPFLIPIIEEGVTGNDFLKFAVEEYLRELKFAGIDNLILGCAHCTLIAAMIQNAVGENVRLINPYSEIGMIVKDELERIGLQTNSAGLGNQDYFLSDISPEINRISEMFLGTSITDFRKANPES